VILAACDRSQESYEDPDRKHGVFTYALLQALGDKFDEADANHDGKVDAEEMYRYSLRLVPGLLRELKLDERAQRPQRFPEPPAELDLAKK
jgi:hypothetical protein